jgi:hypothetical protein
MADCASMLSDYEQKRAQNIERNNAKLRSLGLISVQEEMESNAAAWGYNKEIGTDRAGKFNSNGSTLKKRKITNSSKESQTSFSRRQSNRLRLRMVQSDTNTQVFDHGHDRFCRGNDPSALDKASKESAVDNSLGIIQQRIIECRKQRLEAAKAFAGLPSAEVAKKNPTATYDHCLMRVRSMSEKALETRIKMIERAAGKCCIIKMAIFKCCLEEEKYMSLAEKAGQSLERLKALKPECADDDVKPLP